MYSRSDRFVAGAVFAITFVVFRLSPLHPLADSRFEMLFSQQLLRHHSFGLDPSIFPEIQSPRPIDRYERGVDFPYQLERCGDRLYYWFPPGSTVLSVPFVAL